MKRLNFWQEKAEIVILTRSFRKMDKLEAWSREKRCLIRPFAKNELDNSEQYFSLQIQLLLGFKITLQ